MTDDLRQTGIETLGEMPWGTHFCHFYETKEDLLDILIPYFKAGLENNEFCLWVISAPLIVAECLEALRESVPELERHMAKRSLEIHVASQEMKNDNQTAPGGLKQYIENESIEVVPHDQWYLEGGSFEAGRVIRKWKEKLDDALARGYAGMRVNGNEAWLTDRDWTDFLAYEKKLNETLANQRMIVLCAYPLGDRRAGEIFDVARAHEFAIAKRRGHWETLESPEIKRTKAELAMLKEGLERKVQQRTKQLAQVNHELKESQRKLNQDIAERKEAESALRESEARLREILELLPAAVYVCDNNGIIQQYNPMAAELWGQRPRQGDPDQLFCGSFRLFRRDGTFVPHEKSLMAETLRTGTPVRNEEVIIQRPDGSQVTVMVSIAPLRNQSGEQIGAINCFLDITERRNTEEALRKTQAVLARAARVTVVGELTASIAHEINQPLAGVVTSANAGLNWLDHKPPNLIKARESMERAVRDGIRAGEVLTGIRALLKKESNARSRVQMNQIVHDVAALAEVEMRQNDIELISELDFSLPAISGDATQLQQVVLNLIMNAIEAMSEAPNRQRVLRLRSEMGDLEGKPAVSLKVSDTGLGIDGADRERLFDAFYTTKAEGMGIGLWISRSIIEGHGGQLTVHSNDGPGATFQILLPSESENPK